MEDKHVTNSTRLTLCVVFPHHLVIFYIVWIRTKVEDAELCVILILQLPPRNLN